MSKQNPQTGPKTVEGKFTASLNHLKHGAASKTLFLPTDDPNEFFALLENTFEQYQPAFDQDAALVTRCVHDHWILLRRERAADSFELALHQRQPDTTLWAAADLHEMHLRDRYKTEAARTFTRSLKNLQTLQKMQRDDKRWRHQLARETQRLAVHAERAQLAQKPKHIPLPPIPPNQQMLYIGYEDGVTTHYETSPTNSQLRNRLSPADQIVRTYNFVGGVPPAYQHLITPDAYQCGASTSVTHHLTYQEWSKLAVNE